ncbi:MAG: energy-coupling factor ABC transporter permease [Candidatus Methylomirabilis sp.]|nr:energy-coupling factor ABC transporter permease [Deltaproteobacteria bacterium]
MHIEPGFVSAAKVMGANAAALGLLGLYLKGLVRQPMDIVKALLAAVFFSIFMQSFHLSVGPSELHFIGAMSIYLTLGFLPTMFGFAVGLLFQGLVFTPTDLPHLAVNSLSLIAPLMAVHYAAGKDLFEGPSGKRLSWPAILKLDGIYYGGVTAMVGFWLFIGEVETPFSAWLSFAASYLAVVAVEPFITLLTIKTLKRYESAPVVRSLFVAHKLRLGA